MCWAIHSGDGPGKRQNCLRRSSPWPYPTPSPLMAHPDPSFAHKSSLLPATFSSSPLFFLLRQFTCLSAGWCMAKELGNLLAPPHRALRTAPHACAHTDVFCVFDMLIPHVSAWTPASWPTHLPLPNHWRPQLSSSSSFPSTILGQKPIRSSNATISNTPSSLRQLLPVLNCK